MNIAKTPLNSQALTLEDAQSEIRRAVKDAYILGKSRLELDKQITQIIKSALDRIRIPSLKEAARRSLLLFYQKQRLTVRTIPREALFLYLSLLKLGARGPIKKGTDEYEYTRRISTEAAKEAVRTMPRVSTVRLPSIPETEVIEIGQPLRKFADTYFKENIKPTFERMAAEEALDPDSEDYLGRIHTLRNRAEREVRYEGHTQMLDGFKARGIKLVIISSHADCSERCRPFQGNVYSLDGTSGVTPDGRRYEPIETATDVWTKDGKWKNGLFGFNCRHFAVEYKDGYKFPKVSEKTEKAQYDITLKQRALERHVREWRERALMLKGTGDPSYSVARKKAIEWNKRYQAYSRDHNRAFYKSRVQILQ